MLDYLEKYQLKKGVREYYFLAKDIKDPLYAGDENLINYCLSFIDEKDIAGQTGIPNEKCILMVNRSKQELLNIIEDAVSNRDNEVIDGEVVEDAV